MSNLKWTKDALGNQTDYLYDDFNRLKEIIYPMPGSVIPDNIPPGHVTVREVSPDVLKDAATKTGIKGKFPK